MEDRHFAGINRATHKLNPESVGQQLMSVRAERYGMNLRAFI